MNFRLLPEKFSDVNGIENSSSIEKIWNSNSPTQNEAIRYVPKSDHDEIDI